MKKLKVDIDEIASEMERPEDFDTITRFDTETGEVVSIPHELMDATESEDEDAMEELPEWEKNIAGLADDMLSDDEGRYVDIPRKPSYESYNLMVEFAYTVKNRSLKEKLEIALDGKGAFGRFKNVLSGYPDEEKRWYAFKDGRMQEDVIDWLNSIGIEPVE